MTLGVAIMKEHQRNCRESMCRSWTAVHMIPCNCLYAKLLVSKVFMSISATLSNNKLLTELKATISLEAGIVLVFI